MRFTHVLPRFRLRTVSSVARRIAARGTRLAARPIEFLVGTGRGEHRDRTDPRLVIRPLLSDFVPRGWLPRCHDGKDVVDIIVRVQGSLPERPCFNPFQDLLPGEIEDRIEDLRAVESAGLRDDEEYACAVLNVTGR